MSVLPRPEDYEATHDRFRREFFGKHGATSFYGDQLTLQDMAARLSGDPVEWRRRERWRKVRLVIGCALCAVLVASLVAFVVWCLRTAPGPFLIGLLASLFGSLVFGAAAVRR